MKFNRLLYIPLIGFIMSCTTADFEKYYTDPSKLSETTVGKQFTGMIYASRQSVLPTYWDNFVIRRITSNRYSQAVGWVNSENQYVPGSAAINDRWKSYYQMLGQYRELQKIYNNLGDVEKSEKRVFMIAAATYFYDQTQQVVDLHGDIPWSEAGMISANGGDYTASYPKYDKAEAIYTKMLDDLAGFADELRTLDIIPAVEADFKTQDLVNRGDIQLWLKYINSLRINMLMRVSASSEFSERAKSEIATILSNPSQYPIVSDNEDNILFNIHEIGSLMASNDYQRGLEDSDGNIAGKAILDHMLNNEDPRLTYVFEPGEKADGEYLGLDPLLNRSEQNDLVSSQTLSLYNRSTISRNQYFPGIFITATEVHLFLAEYYLKESQDMNAKMHYEAAVRQSVGFFKYLRSISNNTVARNPLIEATDASVDEYLSKDGVAWNSASTMEDKLTLIAEQKWLHLNVVQSNENWNEIRRLNKLDLEFWVDNFSEQSLPPSRWIYPGAEQTYNTENYAAVQSQDKLNNPIFWDVN